MGVHDAMKSGILMNCFMDAIGYIEMCECEAGQCHGMNTIP
jgi:hypothetical protein